MGSDFPPGLVIGFVLGLLYSALIWTDHVYNYNIETARAACAPYGGIAKIESRVFENANSKTITLCRDGTKIRASNKP